MIRVAATFRSREALVRSQEGMGEDVLFVPEFAEASVGSTVLVQVSAPALTGGLFIEGVVAWRRLQSVGGFARGSGVRVLSQHLERLHFLRRWAGGDASAPSREYSRFPCAHRVLISFAGAKKTTQRLVHGTIEDVSQTGALLVTPSPLVGATELLIDMPEVMKAPVAARVVWSAGTRAGLAVVPDANWTAFVTRVARALDPEVRIDA